MKNIIKNEIANFINNEYRTVEDMVFINGAVIRLEKNEDNTISVIARENVAGGRMINYDEYHIDCNDTIDKAVEAAMRIYNDTRVWFLSKELVAFNVKSGNHALEYITKFIQSYKGTQKNIVYAVPEINIWFSVNLYEDGDNCFVIWDENELPSDNDFDIDNTNWNAIYRCILAWFESKVKKLSDLERDILVFVEYGENDSEIELTQPAINVKIRVFKHYDGVCGIIVDSMLDGVDTFKLNGVDIEDVRYFVTDHDGIVDFDWLDNAVGITVEANERFLAK